MKAQLDLHFRGAHPRWYRVKANDSLSAELADGHYSRQTPGADHFMASGRKVVLHHVTRIGRAVWGVVLNLDPVGTLRWRNSIFHNASGDLTSDLIIEATWATYAEWALEYGPLPTVPLTTEVDIAATARRRSQHHEPGHCYRVAGWREVRRTDGSHGRPPVVVLEAP